MEFGELAFPSPESDELEDIEELELVTEDLRAQFPINLDEFDLDSPSDFSQGVPPLLELVDFLAPVSSSRDFCSTALYCMTPSNYPVLK